MRPRCQSREGETKVSAFCNQFPEEPLRLCSKSGSNLRGGNSNPFWEGFLAGISISSTEESHVLVLVRESLSQRGLPSHPLRLFRRLVQQAEAGPYLLLRMKRCLRIASAQRWSLAW